MMGIKKYTFVHDRIGGVMIKIIFMKTLFLFLCCFLIEKVFSYYSKKKNILYFLLLELIGLNLFFVSSSLWIVVIPMLVSFLLFVVSFYLAPYMKSWRKKPVVIIEKGKLKFNELRNITYSLDELLTKLRESGITEIEKVKYAVLETDGKLSILKEDDYYPLPIILDGKLEENVLKMIGKDETWVEAMVSKHHMKISEVFYAFYRNQRIYIVKKKEI